jgi:hypothetical protein
MTIDSGGWKMTEEQKKLLDLVYQVGQQVGVVPPLMVPITGETVGSMSIAELEAALVALPLSGQSDKPQVIYAKCTPSRSGCSGFGG